MAQVLEIQRLAMGLMTHLVRSTSTKGTDLFGPATVPCSCPFPFTEFGL